MNSTYNNHRSYGARPLAFITLLILAVLLISAIRARAQQPSPVASLNHNINNELIVDWFQGEPNVNRPTQGSVIQVVAVDFQFTAKVLHCFFKSIVIDVNPGTLPIGSMANITVIQPAPKSVKLNYTWLNWTAKEIDCKRICIRNTLDGRRLVLYRRVGQSRGDFQFDAVKITNLLD